MISLIGFSEEPFITVPFVLSLFLVYYCNVKGLQYFLKVSISLSSKVVFLVEKHIEILTTLSLVKCSFQFKLKLYNTFNMHIRCALLNLDKNKAYQIKT